MRYILSLLVLTISFVGLRAQHKKVLFIGNSYTYFWNLPQCVQALSFEDGDSIITHQSTAGGANLGQHWNKQKGLQTHQALSSEKWDYVILQDHSLRAIQHPDSLGYYMNKWVVQASVRGSKSILYNTWARSFDPTMTEPIAQEYETIAKNLGVGLAPVGRIWAKAREMRPDLPLYDKDESHPAPLGTYLTALTFYSIITGNKTSGLPSRLKSKDIYGQPLHLLIVSPKDAQFCQSVVDNFLSTYQNK